MFPLCVQIGPVNVTRMKKTCFARFISSSEDFTSAILQALLLIKIRIHAAEALMHSRTRWLHVSGKRPAQASLMGIYRGINIAKSVDICLTSGIHAENE